MTRTIQFSAVLLLIMTGFLLCIVPFNTGQAITSIDTNFANKSIVFFFASDSAGHVVIDKQVATGFLLGVPKTNTQTLYTLLVTARHIVDPVWAGCADSNPSRLFLRVNKKQFNPQTDETGVGYIPVELIQNGIATWQKNADDNVDVAVLNVPPELVSGDYDVRFMNFRDFGKPEEIAKLGIGSQVASTGLVPGLEGKNRNYPIFKFGKVASIPEEMAAIRCRQDAPPRQLRVWWVAASLVPGNSGSPIYFDPLFPPGGDISSGEPRAMIIGLQSIALQGADLAGMTPASYIIDVISHAVPKDADLSLGLPSK